MSKLPLSLDAYDWCRSEIISWAQSRKNFTIYDIPPVDEVPATVRACVLLDLLFSKAIYCPGVDNGPFRISSNLRPECTPRRCVNYMTYLLPLMQETQNFAIVSEPLTPKAEQRRRQHLEAVMSEANHGS